MKRITHELTVCAHVASSGKLAPIERNVWHATKVHFECVRIPKVGVWDSKVAYSIVSHIEWLCAVVMTTQEIRIH